MELQKLIDGLKAHRNGAASYESVDETIRVFEAILDVDGEKVRKGLECCILRDPDDHRRCGDCPYNPHAISNEPCANGLKYNALSLIRQQQERIAELEAQEAKAITYKENWMTGLPVANCPKCGRFAQQFYMAHSEEETHFCPWCGQAVKWDE